MRVPARARRSPVDDGVADHRGLAGADAGPGAQMREAGRIGLPRKRAVAADDRVVREEPAEVEAVENPAGRGERLVGEHGERRAGAERLEHGRHPVVRPRVVEQPRVVDREKARERVRRRRDARRPRTRGRPASPRPRRPCGRRRPRRAARAPHSTRAARWPSRRGRGANRRACRRDRRRTGGRSLRVFRERRRRLPHRDAHDGQALLAARSRR